MNCELNNSSSIIDITHCCAPLKLVVGKSSIAGAASLPLEWAMNGSVIPFNLAELNLININFIECREHLFRHHKEIFQLSSISIYRSLNILPWVEIEIIELKMLLLLIIITIINTPTASSNSSG